MNKMLMLRSCVPASFKCQSKYLGHSCSLQYIQMNFSYKKRKLFGFVFKLLCLDVSA